jgi:hypothetical protein
MENNKIFNVKNRSTGVVVYSLPEVGIRREFAPGETKKISYDELEKLTFRSGGRTLIQNYLQVQDIVATQSLNIRTEPEYFYSEKDIIEIMKNGSLDKFLDMLDFADVGVIDLIKKYAVELPMNDYSKMRALKDKTGFDAEAALRHNREDKEADSVENISTTAKRRVAIEEPAAPATETAEPARRTTPEYKVVSQG